MYHVSAQGVDKRMINVHYYYYKQVLWCCELVTTCSRSSLDYCTRSSATVNNSNAKIHFDYGAGWSPVQKRPNYTRPEPPPAPSRKMNGRLLGMWHSVNREDPITVGEKTHTHKKKKTHTIHQITIEGTGLIHRSNTSEEALRTLWFADTAMWFCPSQLRTH